MSTKVDTTLGLGGKSPLKSLFSDMNIKLVNTTKGSEDFTGHYVLFFNKSGSSTTEDALFDL